MGHLPTWFLRVGDGDRDEDDGRFDDFASSPVGRGYYNLFTDEGEVEDVQEVNLIDTLVQERFENESIDDPLAKTLMFSEGLDCLENEEGVGGEIHENSGLEVCPVMAMGQWTPIFGTLTPNPIKPHPSELEAPTPERKPLPSTLKYAFLGKGESYPVVISSSLTEAQEASLLEVLTMH